MVNRLDKQLDQQQGRGKTTTSQRIKDSHYIFFFILTVAIKVAWKKSKFREILIINNMDIYKQKIEIHLQVLAKFQ